MDILRTNHCINLGSHFVSLFAWELGITESHLMLTGHKSGKNITLTDKIGYIRILRTLINILRGTNLHNQSIVHNNDKVRHGKCLFLIMGNIDKGNA